MLEETKKAIDEQCKIILEQYKDTLREVEIYKWAVRVFFTIVLGGSIIGIFQLQDYLDDRIAKGTTHLEQLVFAKLLSDNGQYMDALPELVDYARSVSSSPVSSTVRARNGGYNIFGDFNKAGPSIRSYFFLDALDVLTGIQSNDIEAAEFGAPEWEELKNNERFREDILENPRWANDPRVLNRLGLGAAKFAKDREAAVSARQFF